MEAGPAPPWQSWPCETRRFTHQPSLLSLNPANLQIWGRAFRDFKGAAAPWAFERDNWLQRGDQLTPNKKEPASFAPGGDLPGNVQVPALLDGPRGEIPRGAGVSVTHPLRGGLWKVGEGH